MDFTLAPNGVDVWTLRTDSVEIAPKALETVLAPDEVQRANRFHFEHLRRDYVLSHAAMRLLCAGYLGRDPSSLAMNVGVNGKPELADGGDLRFNMSHSGGLTALAFIAGGVELGVDVERIREIKEIEGIVERFFCREEADQVLQASEAERSRLFQHCWTRKEAFIKATGDGLSMALDSFQVSLTHSEPVRILHVGFNTEEAACWTLQNLELMQGYAGALCYRSAARAITCKSLDISSICNFVGL